MTLQYSFKKYDPSSNESEETFHKNISQNFQFQLSVANNFKTKTSFISEKFVMISVVDLWFIKVECKNYKISFDHLQNFTFFAPVSKVIIDTFYDNSKKKSKKIRRHYSIIVLLLKLLKLFHLNTNIFLFYFYFNLKI